MEQYLLNIASEKGDKMYSATRICVARTAEQARAVGIRFGYQEWPIDQGYINHQSTAEAQSAMTGRFLAGNNHLDFCVCHCGSLLSVDEKENTVDIKQKTIMIIVQQLREAGYTLKEICGEYKFQTGTWGECPAIDMEEKQNT